MIKVCWLTTQASPYKMKLLNTLGEKAELTVFLDDDFNVNRGEDWYTYSSENIVLKSINKNFFKEMLDASSKCDILINSMYSTIPGLIALIVFIFKKKIRILHADGGIAYDRGFFVNKAIGVIMGMYNSFLSSSEITDKYFEFYNVKREKIKHYRFSSYTNKDIELSQNELINKNDYRIEKNIKGFAILSVGQPIHRKGFDILIRAFEILKNKYDDMSLYIIGGKPSEEIKYIDEHNIKSVFFIENINREELKKYYIGCDCFVLCTREDIWGLVINESLIHHLPTVTSSKCVAGLHFNNKYNAVYIADNNDVDEYINLIETIYLKNEDKIDYSFIEQYSIENTSEDIYNDIMEVLQANTKSCY